MPSKLQLGIFAGWGIALALLCPMSAAAQTPRVNCRWWWCCRPAAPSRARRFVDQSQRYKAGSILDRNCVDAVPEIKQYAQVRVEQIANIGSTNINTALWLKLAARINAIFNEDPKVAGVVITHGTNTLEETAYFCILR